MGAALAGETAVVVAVEEEVVVEEAEEVAVEGVTGGGQAAYSVCRPARSPSVVGSQPVRLLCLAPLRAKARRLGRQPRPASQLMSPLWVV